MPQSKDSLTLPKLNLWEISLHVADLWLVSEGSIQWVKENRIRRVWQIDFFSFWIVGIIQFLVPAAFEELLDTSPSAALIWRWFMVFCIAWLLCTTTVVAGRYYRYLLATGKDVRFRNVIVFWCTWISLFALLYRNLYFVKPGLYSFSHPAFIPLNTLHYIGYQAQSKLLLQFLLYSASTSTTLSTPGLSSSSMLISAFNLAEVLGAVLLIGLLLATFVNKSAASHK